MNDPSRDLREQRLATLARANKIANAQRMARMAEAAASMPSAQQLGESLSAASAEFAKHGYVAPPPDLQAWMDDVVRDSPAVNRADFPEVWPSPRPGFFRRLWFRLTGR